jgi:hypothetical protein
MPDSRLTHRTLFEINSGGSTKVMKRKLRPHKLTRPPLQIEDYMCRRCRVQATREADHICGLCKAFGKNVEPERAARWDLKVAVKVAESLDHWFRVHHLIGFDETARAGIPEED